MPNMEDVALTAKEASYYKQQGASSLGAKPTAPRRETQLDNAFMELCNIHDRLNTIARRTNNVADEVVGMRPPSPDSPIKEEEPYTKIDKLRVKMNHINLAISAIEGIVDRLESI